MIMHKKIALITSGRVGNRYDVFSKKIDAKFMISTLKNIYNISHKDIIEIPSTLNSKSKSKIYFVELYIKNISNDIVKIDTISKLPNEFIQYPISEFPSSKRFVIFFNQPKYT